MSSSHTISLLCPAFTLVYLNYQAVRQSLPLTVPSQLKLTAVSNAIYSTLKHEIFALKETFAIFTVNQKTANSSSRKLVPPPPLGFRVLYHVSEMCKNFLPQKVQNRKTTKILRPQIFHVLSINITNTIYIWQLGKKFLWRFGTYTHTLAFSLDVLLSFPI